MKFTFIYILLGCIVPNSSRGQLVINEIQTLNSGNIADEDFENPAWMELYNAGNANLSLNGYTLTDDALVKNKWKLPNLTLKPQERLLIFLSGKDTIEKINHWETAVHPNNNWRYSYTDTMWNNVFNPYAIYTPSYDASSWAQGKGGIGLADGDDSTIINATANYTMRYAFKLNNKNYTNLKKCYIQLDNENQCYIYVNWTYIATFSNNPLKHIRNGDKPRSAMVDLDAIKYYIDNFDSIVLHIRYFSPKDSFHQTSIPYLSLGYSDNVKHINNYTKNPYLKDSVSFIHTNFKLKPTETIYLFDKTGTQIDKKKTEFTARNISFARIPDGGSWCITDEPSPDSSNTGKHCAAGFLIPPACNLKSGFVTKNSVLKLATTQQNVQIRYTTNGDIPTDKSFLYKSTGIKITADVSIRALCVDTSGAYLPSKPITNIYIINDKKFKLPIISITADSLDLFNTYDGLYATNGYVGAEKRTSHIEYLLANGSPQFELDAMLSIHGNGSRGYAKKSLRVETTSDFDSSFIHYKLFPFRNYTNITSFNLRSGSQDQGGSMMRDELTNHIMLKTNLDVMEHNSCFVYLNGQPWGIYHIREKQDNDCIENISGVSKDSMDIIGIFGVHNGTANASYSLYSWYGSDLSVTANYDSLNKYLDIKNFVDYITIETFINNMDWPGNNTKLWRPTMKGGKFRYLLYDTDFGTRDIFSTWGTSTASTKLQSLVSGNYFGLYYLARNTKFKNYFVNRYADLMNTILTPANYAGNINYIKNNIKFDMPKEIARWGNFYDTTYWSAYVKDLDTFVKYSQIANRDSMVTTFSLTKKVNLTLKLSSNAAGVIKLNTIIPITYPWSGVYFDGVPITVTAVPNPGYSFDSFVIDSVTYKTKTVTINLTPANNIITAYFNGATISFPIIASEINYNCSDKINSGNWIELHNNSSMAVDLTGYKLKTSKDYAFYEFADNYILPANKYIVICEDTALFKKVYPSVYNRLGNIKFPLDNHTDSVVLIDNKGKNKIAFAFTDSLPWPECADGTGRTLELKTDSSVMKNGSSWFNGCIGGSPGKAYSICFENIIISEISYNAKGSHDAGEWVELHNTTNSNQSVSLWHFKDGDDSHDYTIPAGTIIPANGYLVLANTKQKFKKIYPNVKNVVDSFNFSLSNNGENLRLFDSKLYPKFSVNYHNENYFWPAVNGNGYTLEYNKVNNDFSDKANWGVGCFLGSPGTFRTICQEHIQLVASEINYHSLPEINMGDWMEFKNISNDTLNVKNWKLSTSIDSFILPSQIIYPNDYILIVSDTNNLLTYFPKLSRSNIVYNSQFDLNDTAEIILLTDTNKFRRFEMSFNSSNQWDTMARANGYTLSLKQIPAAISEYSDAANWTHGCLLGNPQTAITSCSENLIVSEINFNSDSLKKQTQWIELYNKGIMPVNLNGYKLNTATTANAWAENKICYPFQRLIIAQDSADFSINYSSTSVQMNINLQLNDTLSIYDINKTQISKVIYHAKDYFYANGLGKTIENVYDTNYITTANEWTERCFGGSPSKAYIQCFATDLVVSEISYNPITGFSTDAWFELYHIGSANTKNLGNYYISFNKVSNIIRLDSISNISPKGKLVFVSDSAAFKYLFPFDLNTINVPKGFIQTGLVRIYDANQNPVFVMQYDNTFGADGNGKTISMSNPTASMDDYTIKQNWVEQCIGGSPAQYQGWCDTPIVVSEINYSSATSSDAGDWIELRNQSAKNYNIKDITVFDSQGKKFKLSSNILNSDSNWVLVADTALFNKQFKGTKNSSYIPLLSFDAKGNIRIYNKDSAIIYYNTWSNQTPWNDSADGKGYTLEYNTQYTDYSDAATWFIGCPGGSPGKYYNSICTIIDTISNGINQVGGKLSNIKLFPNPANSILNIESINNKTVQFTIYNMLGQPVYIGMVGDNTNHGQSKTTQIDITQWSVGIYMFVVKENNYSKVYKFVKE
ncbi:MAG: lamin tail domain-containing protein [Bacteroidota bacterium]|nr:lamin tail domain-containing protein [Bacteroidota bacterium]